VIDLYCVIQKVFNKKVNANGEYKELKVEPSRFTIEGRQYYSYIFTGGRFERPHKEAFKVSIHRSYRECGKVKKEQWVLFTVSYYDLIGFFSLYDYADSKISKISEETGESIEYIYEITNKKLDPLIEETEKEFEATEEYKTKVKNTAIIAKYTDAKCKFEKKYGKSTYDYCYDIFGVLRNEEYLKELEANYKAQQEYNRSYYENFKSNYSDYDFSGYSSTSSSTYTENEKDKLKKIYRVLASKFHPDISKDDGEMMKFVNKLKDQWGI
jgi:hypothetical protein